MAWHNRSKGEKEKREMASGTNSNNSYRDMPFSAETPDSEFYTYLNFSELALKSEDFMEDIIKCRTIGILNSEHGRYYLNDLTPSHEEFERIQVSMLYLEPPPQSTVIPYAVQLFGDLQWKKRPVLYARILQVMTPAIAIRLNNVLADVKILCG